MHGFCYPRSQVGGVWERGVHVEIMTSLAIIIGYIARLVRRPLGVATHDHRATMATPHVRGSFSVDPDRLSPEQKKYLVTRNLEVRSTAIDYLCKL